MGIQIEDGRGSGISASVSENRLNVSSRSDTRAFYRSREGQVYSAVAIDAGPAAGEFTLYLQNTSTTKKMVVVEMTTSSVDTDVIWKLHEVTGVATGTTITPVNHNLSSGNTAEATCIGGAGGVGVIVTKSVLDTWYNGSAYNTVQLESHDTLIVGSNQAIAIEYDAGTGGAVSVVVRFFYEEQ